MQEIFDVDDCLVSVHNVNVAKRTVTKLVDFLKYGGFQLTKWASNNPSVLSDIAKFEISPHVRNIDTEPAIQRTLDILWDFHFYIFQKVYLGRDHPITKRRLLSQLSSIFDPLGFVSPVVLSGKLLLKDICRSRKKWDESLTETELQRWFEWKRNLCTLKSICVPQCLKPSFEILNIQLQAISDASEKENGCAVYTGFISVDNQIVCLLVIAKARIAPFNAMTIPRHELTAATFAVRLTEKIGSAC